MGVTYVFRGPERWKQWELCQAMLEVGCRRKGLVCPVSCYYLWPDNGVAILEVTVEVHRPHTSFKSFMTARPVDPDEY